MQENKFRKGLVLAIIVLFVGASIFPSMGKVLEKVDQKNLNIISDDPLFYDDFEDGTLDKWNVIRGDWEVINGTGGNHIAHLNRSSIWRRIIVSNDTVPEDIYIEALVKGDATNDIADTTVGFYSNGEGSSFYWVMLGGGISSGNRLSIGRTINNTEYILVDNSSVTTNNNIWYNVKIVLRENSIFAKIWEVNNNEPSNWQISYSGATPFGNHILIGGEAGQDDEEFWFDNISVLPIPDYVYVDDDFNETTPGWGYDHFDNIQDGIDVVNVSGTVYVYNGTYYENVVVNKTINLVGENRENTIIDAQNNGHVIQVLSNWTNLSNFTAKNAGPDVQDGTGIKLTSVSYVNISNVKCGDSEKGIVLYDSHNCILNNTECHSNEDYGILVRDDSSYNLLINNKCIWNGFYNLGLYHSSGNILINNTIAHPEGCIGIDMYYSSGNEIRDCTFYDNDRNLLMRGSHNNYIHGNQFSSTGENNLVLSNCGNNIVSNNSIKNGGIGIKLKDSSNNNCLFNNTVGSNWWAGIDLEYSYNNNISHCVVHDVDYGEGIKLYRSSYNNITDCSIYNNTASGIYLNDSSNNTIKLNYIANNDKGICLEDSSNNNHFFHNDLINNTMNAYDECTNTWYNTTLQEGNYWFDYNGTDLDGDGIGDTPYNISGGDNQDLYPLMHHFELYYILNISAPPEVNEGELFNVIVKSIGGPVVPLATVEFNDELKFTDSDGRAYFIAPLVETDIYYNITATKEGYTGDTETILIEDVPGEFVSTFIFGRLDNLTTEGEIITFEALNIRCATFFPFTFNAYTSGELLTISKDYFGLVGARFIFAFCGLTYQPSTISMNKFSQDDSANTVIWLVSEVEGNPLRTKDVETMLLNESGQPQPDAEITFNEATGEGYINPGDTFTVVAPSDGYYVFMLTHKISGATIYKGSLTHY